MNILKKVGNKITCTAGRAGLKIQKYSPEITLTLGLITFVGTVVTASKATLKLEETVKKDLEDLKKINEYQEERPDSEYVKNEDYKRDKLIVYSRIAVNTAKLYAPSIALGAISIGLILTSRNILHKRYLAAVTAYESVSKTLEAYRGRVRDTYGEEIEKKLYYNAETEKLPVEGGGEIETLKIDKKDLTGVGDVMFDETNPNWDSNMGFNLSFLRAQESWFNNLLQARGHIFLNEVYKALGFPHTSDGAIVGWIKDEHSYIDFGIFEALSEYKEGGRRGPGILLLHFNHQGIIFDKI